MDTPRLIAMRRHGASAKADASKLPPELVGLLRKAGATGGTDMVEEALHVKASSEMRHYLRLVLVRLSADEVASASVAVEEARVQGLLDAIRPTLRGHHELS